MIQKYEDLLLGDRTDLQVFVPMCGKSNDLKWFHSKGHRVVGVEFLDNIARQFFEDNQLPMEETLCDVIHCKLLQTPDKRVRIFVCSIFDFQRACAGPMDVVWDRAGITSIKDEDRKRCGCPNLILELYSCTR